MRAVGDGLYCGTLGFKLDVGIAPEHSGAHVPGDVHNHTIRHPAGKPELAAQIPGLVILDRCRCGDDFCSSFYTQPKPDGRYGPGHECMDLDADEGMVLLDVVTGTIVHVEILNRDDIRRKLIVQLP